MLREDEEEEQVLNHAMDEAEDEGMHAFRFEMLPYTDRRLRKFGVHRRVFTTRLQQSDYARLIPCHILPQLIEEALQRAINEQVLESDENDNNVLLINLSSNHLHHAHQSHRVTVGDWRRNTEPARLMLEMISKILNSNEQFRLDDTFHLEVTHIQDPGCGSGRKRLKLHMDSIDEMLRRKKSVIVIDNRDRLCCARALVTIKAKRDCNPKYDSVKRGDLQRELAEELHREARVPEGPCGLGELNQFQIILSEYQIVVVSVDHGYQVIFKGPSQPEEKQLILVKVGEHYHACSSLKGFFGKSYYCLECERGFDHDDLAQHRCPGKKCYACHQPGCQDFRETIGSAQLPCTECNRNFFGPTCLDNHRAFRSSSGTRANAEKNNSVCHTHRKCATCGKVLHTVEGKGKELRHQCGYTTCPCCKEYLDLDQHQCYLQPVKEKEKKKKQQKRKRGAAAGLATLRANDPTMDLQEEEEPLFVYFDIEARQDQGEHVPNLICAERGDSDQPFEFKGETCVKAFLDWVRDLTKTNDPDMTCPIIIVAHNFQGYDSYFVLDEFYKQGICPDQIVNGAKILCMSVGQLKFIDSMCFLQMPLSGFTEAFGLQELKKGFFPHFFNTTENQNYVGPIPAQDYYDPQGMKPERKAEFLQWYHARRGEGYEFNFQEDLAAYCRSDVRLLKQGCMQFQQEFEHLAQFNPMAKCITIASACNRYYRKMCLQPHTIASEPIRGWHGKGKPHSHTCLEWLYWEENCLRHQDPTTSAAAEVDRIAHAGNRGEHKIVIGHNTMYVDGYDEETKTVYEFEGCFYHGCPKCFPNQDNLHRKHDDMTMREIYQRTLEHNLRIREAGYNLIVTWECEWKQKRKTHPDIQQFLDTLQMTPRLEPRDAFFGGRTNAVQLYFKTGPDEEIRYVDYTSLYPWVNKNCSYPVGHPIVITQPEETDISQYFGLVKCTVLPPYELYHPVLPYRYGGKLTFPLCRSCVETQLPLLLLQRTHHCSHGENDRSLTSTWCTPELQKAVAEGYIIQKVYEVWHFPLQSTDLFKCYVNTFLKIKQEASGWPSQVGEDPLKRQQYVKDYYQREGICLDEANIQKNPGRRSLAKMMLNSFWGKFGQQSNKCQVEAMTSPAKFYKLLRDDSQNIHSVRIVNQEMIEVVHNYQAECDPVQVNVNIFVACFTTCWARLKLYKALKYLRPEQTLYFDTDSIIYLWREGLPELPLGNYLGEFTNELDADHYIVEYASAGPKNYGYKTNNGKVECKVRGFSLNARGKEQLNFDVLRDNVLAEVRHPEKDQREIPVWNPHRIVRDNKDKTIRTETEIKRYQLVFDKRVVDPETFRSFPYGYARRCMMEEEEDDVEDMMEITT